MSHLVNAMFKAVNDSLDEARNNITNVRWAGWWEPIDAILFEMNGITYKGVLKGRNQDLVVGVSKEQDAAIALRTILDGDAYPY